MTALLVVALVFMGTLAILVLAAEVGFLLGRRHRASSDQDGRSQISIVEGALLGVLGLLLGFSFSMAVGRYDVRQDLVVREANAIGTVLLRCDFLPSQPGIEAKEKLRAYTDLRLEFVAAGFHPEKLAAVAKKTSGLQTELWALATNEARRSPTPVIASLISALNELFDLGEARRAALDNRVPSTVWVVLYLVAGLTSGSLGYGTGLTGRRLTLPISLVPILMGIILTLLLDLDQPRKGLIRPSQESMIRVRDSMK